MRGVGNTQFANGSVDVSQARHDRRPTRAISDGAATRSAPSETLGTLDNFVVNIIAGGLRALRLEPDAISPNVIGGNLNNSVDAAVHGATIGGGGAAANSDPDVGSEAPNSVFVHYGTVGGGIDNRSGFAGADPDQWHASTVAGGHSNTASGYAATVAGGYANTASGTSIANGGGATVGGGFGNTSSSVGTTVAGGFSNTASFSGATVAGGDHNMAIAGPDSDRRGLWQYRKWVLRNGSGGGLQRSGGDYSVAMGRRAKALGNGSVLLCRQP